MGFEPELARTFHPVLGQFCLPAEARSAVAAAEGIISCPQSEAIFGATPSNA